MRGLHPKLLERILGMDTVPTTIDDWYAKAAKFDANYHRARAISGRMRAAYVERKATDYIPTYRPPPPPARDPMAMDVDRLTTQQKEDHYKRGLCFECHLPGHRASDHKKKNTSSFPSKSFPSKPRSFTPKRSGYAQIRTIMNSLPEEEKEETLSKMEEEGF